MMARAWSICAIVLVLLSMIGQTVADNSGRTCETNPTYSDENMFARFFDRCYIDSTEANVLGQVAEQLQIWFKDENYPVYILVSLLVILFCVVRDSRGNDDMARYNYIRLQGILLLMRMGLAISITPWMWAAIRQERPCYCSYDGSVPLPLDNVRWWGMPSGITFTSSLVAAHFMGTISIPFGILWIIIMGGASIASGQFSFGQSIVGVVLGLVLHLYSIRTPLYMRIVDFFISLVAGFIAIALAMKAFTSSDFSFAIYFLIGLAWQVYAFTLQFVSFEWGFMKRALTLPLHTLHDVDFMYFRPLNSPTTDSEPPSFKTECFWTVLLTAMLFVVLCGLHVLAPRLNDVNVHYYF